MLTIINHDWKIVLTDRITINNCLLSVHTFYIFKIFQSWFLIDSMRYIWYFTIYFLQQKNRVFLLCVQGKTQPFSKKEHTGVFVKTIILFSPCFTAVVVWTTFRLLCVRWNWSDTNATAARMFTIGWCKNWPQCWKISVCPPSKTWTCTYPQPNSKNQEPWIFTLYLLNRL